jgi:hypothetical protein
MKSSLETLQKIRQELKPRSLSEHQLIFGDAFESNHDLPVSGTGKGYKDYRLADNRILRVRALHPDPPEHKIGADLIYERLDPKEKTVRLSLVQYKIWDGKSLHYNPRMRAQYHRLLKFTCNSHLCDPDDDPRRTYRLPHCAGFFRPTDSLRQPTSHMASSGLHIPLCVVKDSWQPNQNGGESIRKHQIEDRSVSQRVFSELFKLRMLGSKDLAWDTLEALYKKFGIFDADDAVIVHAQEAIV